MKYKTKANPNYITLRKNETHHTMINGHFTASTSTASQNFNTYVIFDAKFDGLVQISDFLRAIE